MTSGAPINHRARQTAASGTRIQARPDDLTVRRGPAGRLVSLPGARSAEEEHMPSDAYSALSHLECARCGTRHEAAQVQGTCSCGSPLLARYDIDRVAAQVSPAEIAARPPDLWRY